MLDIIKVAIEKEIVNATRKILLDLLIQKFSFIPAHVSHQIRQVTYQDGLKALLLQVLKCADIEAFEAILQRVNESNTSDIEESETEEIVNATRKMILESLIQKFSYVPPQVSQQIEKIEYQDGLKALLLQVLKCADMEAFEAVLQRMNEANAFADEAGDSA
jgi:hypothetical protein